MCHAELADPPSTSTTRPPLYHCSLLFTHYSQVPLSLLLVVWVSLAVGSSSALPGGWGMPVRRGFRTQLTCDSCIPAWLVWQASQLSHQLANPAAMSAISDSDLATQHKIFLREQDLTDFDATLIAQFLKTNTTVTLVDLSDNFISNAGTTSISDSLRTNTSVQRLVVYNNGIEDQGASAIAEAVMSNHSLLVVEMSENSIRDPGATALANALKINSSVTDLGLSVNGIGDSGASELAECVRSNSTLRVLTLDFNNVGSDGGRALASAINLNRGLTEVNLSNNAFGDEVRTLLSQVASNRQINIKF